MYFSFLNRSSIRSSYDKPLSLKLQWIIKEIKQKSLIIGNQPRTTVGWNVKSSTASNIIIQHLNETFDDYPNDNEADYSDYGYDDSTDEIPTTTTTTTTTTTSTTTTTTTTTTVRTTTPIDEEDISNEDTNTAFYDYGENDVYIDDDIDESTTTEQPIIIQTTKRYPSLITTTNSYWRERIPYYHRRPAIIWNVNNFEQQDNSTSSTYSSHIVIIFISFIIWCLT